MVQIMYVYRRLTTKKNILALKMYDILSWERENK